MLFHEENTENPSMQTKIFVLTQRVSSDTVKKVFLRIQMIENNTEGHDMDEMID